jgi:hypothetical protein
MEMAVKTDASASATMSLWSQPPLQQDYYQPAVPVPVAIAQTQAHFTAGITNHQSNLQHMQSFADMRVPSFNSLSNTNLPEVNLNAHQADSASHLYTQAMVQLTHDQNSQVQQFQDEIETLMMGTEPSRSIEMQQTGIWSNDFDNDSTSAHFRFADNPWQATQASKSPVDYEFNPILSSVVTDNITPFHWIDTKDQFRRFVSSYPGPESFASDGMVPGLVSRSFNGVGSYSERSETAESFSPNSPIDVQFRVQNDNVRIRRNSDDVPEAHGLPVGSHTERHPGDAFSQSEWLVQAAGEPRSDQSKAMQHIPSNPVFYSESYPVEHTPHPYFTLTSYDQIERDNEFGSPDFEEDLPSSIRPHTLASQSLPTTHTRNERDDLLVQLRRRGLPYKEIKLQGGYKEAESTLRGRFRTLTKEKNDRVRKPHWHPEDVSLTKSISPSLHTDNLKCRLLREAVHQLMGGSGKARKTRAPEENDGSNVQWKEVANYISANGGSYHFGNATCKKKWQELQGLNRR